MKRKLVAALLSVAMVASITPVSALGPVATVEASEEGVNAFKEAMSKFNVTEELGVINASNVDTAYEQYVVAKGVRDGAELDTKELKQVADLDAQLKAVRKTIVSVYIDKMIEEIASVAQTGKVTCDGYDPVANPGHGTDFSTIKDCEEKLISLDVDGDTIKQEVSNYGDYEDAQAAKRVDWVIFAYSRRGLSDQEFINGIGEESWFKNASESARAMAEKYYLYTEALSRLQQVEDAEKIADEYEERYREAKATLDGAQTERNISYAEALIEKGDAALATALESMGITSLQAWVATGNESADAYNEARSNLKDSIVEAKEELENQAAADELTSAINSLASKTISFSDIAQIQDIYEKLQDNEYANRITAKTKLQAETEIAALRKLIDAALESETPNTAFTEAIIKAYPVPAAADVTQADAAAIYKADTILRGEGRILGNDIDALLDKNSASYLAAAGNVTTAKLALVNAQLSAQKAERAFIDAVDALEGVSEKSHAYEYYLNKAKALYDALDSVSKKKDNVKEAYNTLKDYIEAYEAYVAKLSEADIISSLVAGVDALPAVNKLTLANKDDVYALSEILEGLSSTGKNHFKQDHREVAEKLDAAIKAIDNLVVADLVDQINNLTNVKSDATLAEIQAAKAANAAAREAYEALTNTQKAAVTNVKLLTAAEDAVADAELQYVLTQIEQIVKSDLSAMTYEQAKNILEVQEIFSGLDAERQGQVKDSDHYKLAYGDYQKALAAANELVAKVTSLENATVTAIADQTYTGQDIQPTVEVKDLTGKVIDASAYKVAYKDNVDAGTATVIISSTTAGGYTGSTEATFTIKAADLSSAEVSGATKTYTGEAQETTVKAVLGDKTLTAGTDYEISYENNTNVGKATITVTGKGNYTGTATGSFVVKPARVTLNSVTAGSKKLTAKYVGQPGASYKVAYKVYGIGGYKAVYSTSLSKTVTGLKSGTTYKVKILGYVRVDGKTYYTGYGNILKVKVK